MSYKWKPSKSAAQDFARKMNEIDEFCLKNDIHASANNDSYYFTLNGKNYRVSNHSIEKSNACAYNSMGVKIREEYHPEGRQANTIYIHASKTRIMDIYNDLKANISLDGCGRRKNAPDRDER